MANRKALMRLQRILLGVRKAEEARLAGYRSRAAAGRQQAQVLRSAGKRIPGALGRDVAIVDMKAAGAWQVYTDRHARLLDEFAETVDQEAIPLAHRLAVAMGREQALSRLLDQASKQENARKELRSEAEAVGFSVRSRRCGRCQVPGDDGEDQ